MAVICDGWHGRMNSLDLGRIRLSACRHVTTAARAHTGLTSPRNDVILGRTRAWLFGVCAVAAATDRKSQRIPLPPLVLDQQALFVSYRLAILLGFY